MTKLVFLDTETTGLGDECDIWEIGLIAREFSELTLETVDVEHAWQFRPTLGNAEPTGLRIGRYYERLDPGIGDSGEYVGWGRRTEPRRNEAHELHPATKTQTLAFEVARLLDGATIVGAVPDFDARHLTHWLRNWGQCGTWHYHLVDVETFAAGALGLAPPWNFDTLLDRYGLKYAEDHRHTALGDARMVRDLYDAVLRSDLEQGDGEEGS